MVVKVKFEWKLLTAFVTAVGILVALGVISLKNSREYKFTADAVVHTNQVLTNIEQLLVANLNIEVGQRGFELTGREEFLEPYTQGVSQVVMNFDSVRKLTKDNRSQQKRLDTLKSFINSRLQFSSDAISLTRKWLSTNPHPDHVIFMADLLPSRVANKIVMDHIRRITGELQVEETVLLVERMKANENSADEFNQTFVGLLAFIVIILGIFFVMVRSNLKKITASEQKEKNFRSLLESSIESQKRVLIRSVDAAHRYLLFNSSFKASTLNTYGASLQVGMNLLNTRSSTEDSIHTSANFDRALAGESHLSIDESGNSERTIFETYYSPIAPTPENQTI